MPGYICVPNERPHGSLLLGSECPRPHFFVCACAMGIVLKWGSPIQSVWDGYLRFCISNELSGGSHATVWTTSEQQDFLS